jgi:hypothetical protein
MDLWNSDKSDVSLSGSLTEIIWKKIGFLEGANSDKSEASFKMQMR